ncbi:MAG: hypothetical protein PUD59_03340 [bacterium]|nr:hypothetical protein [bacterium]
MKKILLFITLLFLIIGCSNKENKKLLIEWPLEVDIMPSFNFDRSIKKDSKEIFYTDTQITLEQYINYVKMLEENNFIIDWRYSDVDSSNKLTNPDILKDGYINCMLHNDKTSLFIQYVEVDKYNSINKDTTVLYSFKIEIEQK